MVVKAFMAKVNFYLYPKPEDSSKQGFIEAFSKVCQWDPSQTMARLRTGEDVVVEGLKKSEAMRFARIALKHKVFASVGPLDDKWRAKLQKFNEGFRFSWSWFAFLFNSLWYFVKGLWQKLVFYSLIYYAVAFFFPSVSLFNGIIFMFVCGFLGKYDLYLKRCGGEVFWPKLPYHLVRLPFWLVVFGSIGWAVYGGYKQVQHVTQSASYIQEEKENRNSGEPVVGDDFRFRSISRTWSSFRLPPQEFSLDITRQVSEHGTESLSLERTPGTVLMAVVQAVPASSEVPDPELGLLSVVVPDSREQGMFESLEDERLIKLGDQLNQLFSLPSYLKWIGTWFSRTDASVEFIEINKRPWAKRESKVGIHLWKLQAEFFLNSYWTVLNGRGIFVILRAYDDTNKEATELVESFLGRFEATEVSEPGELENLKKGLTLQALTPAEEEVSDFRTSAQESLRAVGEEVSVERTSQDSSMVQGKSYKIRLVSGKQVEGKVTQLKSDGFWFELEPGASVYIRFAEVIEQAKL